MKNNIRISLIAALLLISIIGIFNLSPIAQNLLYHNFSDKRSWLRIANFGDVMSNFPYIIIGIIGLLTTIKNQNKNTIFSNKLEIIPFIVAFIGIMLVGFGSGYYHLNPNNQTLVWDRLPMTISFVAIFSIIIGERINLRASLYLLPLLLIIGIFSIYYWNYTENLNRGDLRLYALIQFFPILSIPLIIKLFPPKYSGVYYLGEMILLYIIAKILEHFDNQIFELTNYVISGHTLKHLASAVATYSLIRYLKNRKLIRK